MLAAPTLFLLSLALLASSQSTAQTPDPTPAPLTTQTAPTGQTADARPADALPVGQIRLHVLVSDKSGHPVTDLPQTNFVLADNGHALPILTFRPAAGPASAVSAPTQVAIVLDAVNVGINTVDFERDQIERFLRSNGGHLPVPVSVLIFTDTGTRTEAVPTQDGNALADDLKKEVIGLRDLRRSAGFWGATERFDLSVRTMRQLLAFEASRPGHKLVLWISPGWPYLSGPGIELSRKEQDSLFRTVIDVSHDLLRSQVTLYTIDPLGVSDAGGLRTIYYQSYLKGVESSRKVDAADLSLQVLATHSGGHVTYGNNDISKAIAAAFLEVNSFYTITAQLPPADQPDVYHDLQIKVESPGVTARTTTGYYTRP